MGSKILKTEGRELPGETCQKYIERIEENGDRADFHIFGPGLSMPLVQRTISEARNLSKQYIKQSGNNIRLVVKTNKWGGLVISI